VGEVSYSGPKGDRPRNLVKAKNHRQVVGTKLGVGVGRVVEAASMLFRGVVLEGKLSRRANREKKDKKGKRRSPEFIQ